MIWEMRQYAIAPGRIADIHTRFREHLPPLLKRHRIEIRGRWTARANAGNQGFVYLIGYRDLAQREAQWRNFYADPDWPIVRARSNGASDIVEAIDITFLRPCVGWQPTASNTATGGVHELVLTRVANGQAAAVSDELRALGRQLELRGGKVLLIADLVTGTDLPKAAMLVAWADDEHCLSSRRTIAADLDRQSALADQIKRFGQPLLGACVTLLLDPAADALPQGWLGFVSAQSM